MLGLVELDVMDSEQVPLIQQRIDILPVDQSSKVLGAAEIIFECVPETLQAKEQAYGALNEFCSEDAILTSTTSSILVTDMARFVKNPVRLFNMHWLNPAYIIPVVEISYHHGTQKEAIARVRSVVEAIGKLVVICGPAPGYIVPRLQALIMNEAARMVEEGVASAEEIDKATRYGLGLRFAALGVLEFIDFGGAEILQRASHQMSESINQNRYKAPAIIEDMVRDNKLGLKSGEGFYKYEESEVKDYQRDVLDRTLSMLRHVSSTGQLKL